MSEMFVQKTIKISIILLQVTISNVTDVFDIFCLFNADFVCFDFPR